MVGIAQRVWIWTKRIYLRITLTKSIAAFFLFTFAHCFLHSIVQGFLYTMDWNANALTNAIVQTARIPQNEFAWLTKEQGVYNLKLCDAVPMERREDDEPCQTIFRSDEQGMTLISPGFRRHLAHEPPLSRRQDANSGASSNGTFVSSIGAYLQPINDADGVISAVKLMQGSINNGNVTTLNEQCTRVVLYADQVLANSRREEFALIGSEFWILGISTFAIVYGSIPHLIAAFSIRLLSTTWSAYSIWRTTDINERFKVLLVEGACSVDFFPSYFRTRLLVQIGDLSLNVLTTLLMIYFLFRIIKTYSAFVFQTIGPPDHIARSYKLLYSLLVCIQITIYVLLTSSFLWVDQLVEGAIASISSHNAIYIFLIVMTIALLLPWATIGWRALRRERRKAFAAFLAFALLLEFAWSMMYYSLVWRWTWIQWPFFACLAVASQAALLACIIVGGLCRYNFGRGLKEYLQAADALEQDDFEPEMFDRDQKSDPADFDLEKSNKGQMKKLHLKADRRPNEHHLSRSFDFGAHQPLPPVTPPFLPVSILASSGGDGDGDLGLGLGGGKSTRLPQTLGGAPARPKRPPTFEMVSAIPTLGKNDPWKSGQGGQGDAEDEWTGARL